MKNNRKKLSRKEIMRRRRRERRLYVITAVFATLCVFAIVGIIIIMDNNAQTTVPGDWIVADAGVEIAAPAYQGGGAVIEVTEGPDFAQIAFGTSEPTSEPTAEPTQEPTTEPSQEPAIESEAVSTIAPESEHLFLTNLQPTVEPDEEPAMPALNAEVERSYITISAAGDFTLGGDYNSGNHALFDSYAEEHGYDYFLQNVRSVFEADDLTFINLEGPLTTSTSKLENRTFNFKGAPEYVQILSGSSVELAGLANNHSLDFGNEGMTETQDVLTSAGVGYCGYSDVWYSEINGFQVACLSVTDWNYTPAQLSEMVRDVRAESDLVIVMIHWGVEKCYEPTPTQESYGRALIDAGADLVLGSHPHVVSGIEQYKGKYIVYSLGNFCFGGNKNPSDKDSMIFQQTFELLPDGTVADAGINIIPCSITSSDGYNDYCPKLLDGSEATRIIRKISVYSDTDLGSVLWMPDTQNYFVENNY